MLKNQKWKYSDVQKILTAQIKPLSLIEITKEYGEVIISRYSIADSPDVLNEEVAQSRPEAGIYRIHTDLERAMHTFKIHTQNIPKGWSFGHPSVIIQADRIYSDAQISGSVLTNQNRKVWTTLTVRGDVGEVPVHGRIWLASVNGKPCYRVELFHPEDIVAMRTFIIHLKKER